MYESGSKTHAEAADSLAIAPRYSEIAIAETIAREHADDWRYCKDGPGWMCWNGIRWSSALAETRVRDSIREAVKQAATDLADDTDGDPDADARSRQARRLAASPTITGVERILRDMSVLAIRVDELDADPALLNTLGGVVDLQSGALMPHEPGRLLTKLTRCSPGGLAPRWQQFLVEAFGDDPALLAYVQRMVGYFLTGEIREHTFWFALGAGGNGKSVFFDTLRNVLGDYAGVAPTETFMASARDHHSTDVASLIGLRLVLASETEEGSYLAESRIKQLTGGDRVKARFLYQNFIEFTPQFKLVIVGNHVPSLRNVDAAMRRRLHVIQFNRTPATPDPHLPEKLAAEGDGILGWAIDGLKAYRLHGLAPPAGVVAASNQYFEDEDTVAAWLAERYEIRAGKMEVVGTSVLYTCWADWCRQNGAQPNTLKWLSRALVGRGLSKGKHPSERRIGFFGLERRSVCPELPDGS